MRLRKVAVLKTESLGVLWKLAKNTKTYKSGVDFRRRVFNKFHWAIYGYVCADIADDVAIIGGVWPFGTYDTVADDVSDDVFK